MFDGCTSHFDGKQPAYEAAKHIRNCAARSDWSNAVLVIVTHSVTNGHYYSRVTVVQRSQLRDAMTK